MKCEKSVKVCLMLTLFIIAFNRLFRSQTALWRKLGVFYLMEIVL